MFMTFEYINMGSGIPYLPHIQLCHNSESQFSKGKKNCHVKKMSCFVYNFLFLKISSVAVCIVILTLIVYCFLLISLFSSHHFLQSTFPIHLTLARYLSQLTSCGFPFGSFLDLFSFNIPIT